MRHYYDRRLIAKTYKIIKGKNGFIVTHSDKLRDEITYNSKLSALQINTLLDLKRISYHLIFSCLSLRRPISCLLDSV